MYSTKSSVKPETLINFWYFSRKKYILLSFDYNFSWALSVCPKPFFFVVGWCGYFQCFLGGRVVSIGITPWGIVEKRNELVGKKMDIPFHSVAQPRYDKKYKYSAIPL